MSPGHTGQVAIDREQSPLYWFGGYWQQETSSCYHGPYYLTGDTAELSEDGTLTFVGRADDVITSMAARIYGRRNSRRKAERMKQCVEEVTNDSKYL